MLKVIPKRNYLLIKEDKLEVHGGLLIPGSTQSSIRYVVVATSKDCTMQCEPGAEVVVDGKMIDASVLGAPSGQYLIQEHQVIAEIEGRDD